VTFAKKKLLDQENDGQTHEHCINQKVAYNLPLLLLELMKNIKHTQLIMSNII
jgi:hypothetical protein